MAGNVKVRIRMYRQGLGDCTLLTFTPDNNKPVHVLIDCGVFQGTNKPNEIMNAVVTNIAKETENHLDVLVVTHEHWDHLSGFHQAKAVWDTIKIDELWLAWTENPDNGLANDIRNAYKKEAANLVKLYGYLNRLYSPTDEHRALLQGLTSILGFTTGEDMPRSSASKSKKTDAILADLKKQVEGRGGKVSYFKPTAKPCLSSVDGINVFVLGPPEDEDALKKTDIRREGSEEVYSAFKPFTPHDSLMAALQIQTEKSLRTEVLEVPVENGNVMWDTEKSLPFDSDLGINLWEIARLIHNQDNTDRSKSATKDGQQSMAKDSFEQKGIKDGIDFLKKNYLVDPLAVDQSDPESDPISVAELEWRKQRQIDNDWLGAAESLALKFDSYTNNTSLVLAFQLKNSNNVLLFPGDAQVGSWQSWHTLKDTEGKPFTPSAKDLLSHTVFYKVSHHGSHNATLRKQGLEMMTHSELIAGIPVNKAMAMKKRWKMPAPKLLAALKSKTKGRVYQTDAETPWLDNDNNPLKENNRLKTDNDLFIDLEIEG